jgi:hypothetical protein
MRLFVNPDSQLIVSASITESPQTEVIFPRSSAVPVEVQFVRDGVIFDPETVTATIATSSVANPTVITTEDAHGFSTGDSVVIADHTGAPKTIAYSNVSRPFVATMTVASPCVATTDASHGFAAGDPVVFGTTGALPTGVVANVTYYVLAAGLTATNFEFALSAAGSAINSSGTQSGVHSVTKKAATIACPAHGFSNGDTITIADHTGATPSVDGDYVISGVTTDTFDIPLLITTGSAGGTAERTTSTPTINGTYTITKVDDYSFTVPVNVTTAGIGGTVSRTVALDLRYTVKSEDQYDQDPSIASIAPGGFIKYGSGNTTLFRGSANFITNACNAALGIEASTAIIATISNGTPAVITTATQTFIAGDRVTFTTTGALPSGITSGVEYYIITAGLTTTTFRISLTSEGTAINTTTAGSGTHTATVSRVADDVAELDLIAELSWGGHAPGKTRTCPHTLTNDLYKVGESSPISTAIAYARVAISNGASQVIVTFASALPSSSWRPTTMIVENTTDVAPLNIFAGIITAKSTTGFTIQLNANTDSANYYLNYECVP